MSKPPMPSVVFAPGVKRHAVFRLLGTVSRSRSPRDEHRTQTICGYPIRNASSGIHLSFKERYDG
jgi:hypothetical protein